MQLQKLIPTQVVPLAHEDQEFIYLPIRGVFKDAIDLDLGEWELVSVDPSFDLENSVGRLEFTVREDEAGLRLERSLTVTADRLPAEDVDDISAMRRALRRVNSALVVVRRAE